jgi:putative ABC transport system permease protein
MIDQTLVEQYFPGEEPIGKRLSMDPDGSGKDNRWFQIVGVVAKMKFHRANEAAAIPLVYFPLAQVERRGFVLLVRTAGPASGLGKTLQQTISEIDPRQPMYEFRSMSQRVAETWATQRLLTSLLAIFAGLALLLATIGLYGVLSYNAARRLREIALRVVLGARPGQIRALMFRHGVRLLLFGCVIGFAGTLASASALRSVLFHVSAIQPAIYLAVAAVLSLATAIACWFPAQRATHVDPIVTLRSE